MAMTFAFHARGHGANPSLAIIFIIFCCCCFLFSFVVFILIFFSFLSLTASTIHQLLHLGVKSQKAVDICIVYRNVYRNSAFSCVHTHHVCFTAIFDPTNEVLL